MAGNGNLLTGMMSASPFGRSKTGKNPTDRGKLWSKVHLWVDERGAPLAIQITGTKKHHKCSVDDFIGQIVTKRRISDQHFCADKCYDYEDVHMFVGLLAIPTQNNYPIETKNNFPP